MDYEEEFQKIIKEIEDKLEKNPELKDEIQKNVENIEKILGYQIDVSVVYMQGLDEYDEIMQKTNIDLDIDEEPMRLQDFIDFIGEEDRELKVIIDPLYMKNGLNKISNVITTTLDDYIVIVPKNDNKDE